MAYTAQQVIDLAVERSALNDANLLPTTQILGYISNSERRIFMMGARMNPNFFGVNGLTTTRSAYTDTWNLRTAPGNVAAITKLEADTVVGTPTVSAGDEINLIDFRYPLVELSPRAYVRGYVLTDYNGELSDDASNYVSKVKVYYSKLPSALATTGQTISLYDEWVDLLVVPIARILSIRDKREEEAALFDQEYTQLLISFQEAVLAFEHGAARPLVGVPAIPLPTGV